MRRYPALENLRGVLTGVALALPLACSIPDRFTGPEDASARQDTGLPGSSDAGGDVTAPQDTGPAPSGVGGEDVSAEAATPSFALTVGLTQVSVVRGASAPIPVTIVPAGGFAGSVSVSVGALPAGVAVSGGPLLLAGGTTTGQITLDAAATAPLSVSGLLEITAISGSFVAPVLSLPIIVRDPPGAPDTTFGGTGFVKLAGAGAIGGHGLAVQPSGGIVYCGSLPQSNNQNPLVVGRITADGSADTTFASSTGRLTTLRPGYDDEVCGEVVPVPAGGIEVAGFVRLSGGANHMMFAAKFTDSGAADLTYGGGTGFAPILDNNVDSKVYALVVQPDGKAILGGFQPYPTPAILRLMPDGTGDNTFDPSPTGSATIGVNTFNFGTQIDQLALLPSGATLAASQSSDFLVFRVTPQGRLDTTYGSNGAASQALPASLTAGTTDIVVQPDGAVVCLGTTSTTFELARFTPTGQLDVSFGQKGRASLPSQLTGQTLALLPDGGFAVAVMNPGNSIGVVRFTAAGALDTTFGNAGFSMIPVNAAGAVPIAVDAAGRVVIGVGQVVPDNSMMFARFWP